MTMRDFRDGELAAMPAGSTNGDALVGAHNWPVTVVIEVPTGGSATYAIKATAPTSAPSPTVTREGPARIEEHLGPHSDIYVTAASGDPLFRVY